MPVTIEVAVTETESEKKAQLALADIIGKNSDMVGSAVGTAASGLISKSVSAADIKTESGRSGFRRRVAAVRERATTMRWSKRRPAHPARRARNPSATSPP